MGVRLSINVCILMFHELPSMPIYWYRRARGGYAMGDLSSFSLSSYDDHAMASKLQAIAYIDT